MAAMVTQYDQHRVRCGCGRVHTATRPEGARSGRVGYGPLCRTVGYAALRWIIACGGCWLTRVGRHNVLLVVAS